jgi:sugar lactone lactonase YvrE
VPAIHIDDLEAIGHGIERPEQVLVARDGAVYASDKASAVARVLAPGGLDRMGDAGGEPNGIALTGDGHFLIANFGLGALQDLDPLTGAIRVLAQDKVGDRPLQWINYVLVDSSGALWVSVCSRNPDLRHTIAHGRPDGYIFRMDGPDSLPEVVADEVNFPNCMALDRDEEYLYVVRTLKADVVRFARRGTRLGPEEQFSPPLGGRRDDEYGEHAAALIADRAVTRRWGMADGCAFDAAGNLWVTLARANRIVAVTPDRQVATIAEDPPGALLSGPTSVAWGGDDMRDVYIGSLETPYILKGRSSLPGMPMVHQR